MSTDASSLSTEALAEVDILEASILKGHKLLIYWPTSNMWLCFGVTCGFVLEAMMVTITTVHKLFHLVHKL